MPMNPRLLLPRASGQAKDPFFSSVSALIRFDGTQGQTTFSDVSSNNLTVGRSGTVSIDTSIKKFGTGSARFTAAGHVTVAANAALNFGTGNFTIEYWTYTGTPTVAYPCHIATTANYQTGVFVIGYGRTASRFYYFYDGTFADFLTNSTNTFTANQWRHVAFVRNGTALRVYVDGVQEIANTCNSAEVFNMNLGNLPMGIGGGSWDGNDSRITDYVDEVRITKGVARYTAAFSPPTTQFPAK